MTSKMRFCPNCGSTNVEFDSSHTNILGEIISNPNKWLCNKCGYNGFMPEGDPEKQEKAEDSNIKFEPKKQEAIDTELGRAYLKYILYISAPAMVLYILYHTVL